MERNIHQIIQENLEQLDDWQPEAHEFRVPESQLIGIKEDINFNKLFEQPIFNEKQRLALDNQHNQKRLTSDQLQQIRKTGTFTVPSQDFPGQFYTWEINKGFQKGTTNIGNTFKDGIAFGTKQFLITIPNRVYKGTYITLWDSLKSIGTGLLRTALLPIGFLNSNKTQVNSKQDLDNFRIEKLIDQLLLNGETNEYYLENDITIRVLEPINLENLATVKYAYEQFMFGVRADQLQKRQGRYEEELAKNAGNESDVKQNLANFEIDEQQEATCNFLEGLINTFPETAKKLIDIVIMVRYIRSAFTKRNKERAKAISDFSKILDNNGILSRIPELVFSKKDYFTQKWDKANPIENYIQNLDQLHLLTRNLNILNSPDYLRVEKETKRVPEETFNWSFRIWLSSHWHISNSQDIDREPYYTVDKYNKYTTTSGKIGWRLANFGIQYAVIMNNGSYWCLANAIYGPFSPRSLYGLEEYQPDKTVDTKTGEIKNTGSTFQTWFGRIRALWRNITRCRQEFKAQPNTGFIGKGFVNPFNWIWNYIIKGAIGTVITFLGHPILTIAVTLISFLLSVTSPIWGLGAVLIKYLFDILIYDTDGIEGAFPLFRYLIWNILIRGVGQFSLSTLGLVGAGALGLGSYVWAGVRASCRYIWDSCLYGCIIKPLGKIPYTDSFTARQVSGPGFGHTYYYHVEPDTVRLLLTLELEREEMTKYKGLERERIDQKLKQYLEFMNSFKVHGLSIDQDNATLKKFKKTVSTLETKLNMSISDHWAHIGLGNVNVPHGKCRMTKEDLTLVLENVSNLCKNFYQDKIYMYLSDQEQFNMWVNFDLVQGDWEGVGRFYMKKVFGESILEPIEEVDNAGFKIKVQHMNIKKYFKGVWAGNVHDDLDDIEAVRPIVKDLETTYTVLPVATNILVTPYNFLDAGNHLYEKYLYLTKKEVDHYKNLKKDTGPYIVIQEMV